jgi:EAL domain-containing protein (putative c-di-GMP-specific phosphodiesterase class I)
MRALGVDFAQGYLVGRPQSLTAYRFPTDLNPH